jgi:hypothetical protein
MGRTVLAGDAVSTRAPHPHAAPAAGAGETSRPCSPREDFERERCTKIEDERMTWCAVRAHSVSAVTQGLAPKPGRSLRPAAARLSAPRRRG